MRVGYLTYGLDRPLTGVGRYSLATLQALAALPDRAEIVLLTTEPEDRHGLWSEFEQYPLPGCRLLSALMSLGNVALSQATLRYKLDIIHDPNGIAPFLGPSMGAKRLVTIHDAFPYVQPKTHNRLDNWRYRWMLPTAVNRANMILTDSRHSQQDIARYLKVPEPKIEVIPCGVEAYFAPVPDNAQRQAVLDRYKVKPPYLLYVGSINGRKNIARLFEAYARLQARRPELKLVIGGLRQWRTQEIDAAFEKFGLEDKVHFTGYLKDEDLPALYSAAEVFVFPSLYEGFGLPPLEAMACGTPVVASNVSSLPEVLGEAAILVDPYDVAAIAEAIEAVLSDNSLRASLRERGLRQAALYHWEDTARQVLQVYQRLMGRADLYSRHPLP